MKSYGPMGMLGAAPPWSVKKVHSSSPPKKMMRNLGVSRDRWNLYTLYTYSSSFAMCFFFIIFIDDLGLQKFTIKPNRHGSFSRDLIEDRSEDDWEVPWPAATEITWFARRTQHFSGRGTGIFFPAMSRCLVLVRRSYTLSNVAIENSLLLGDFFQYVPIFSMDFPALATFDDHQGDHKTHFPWTRSVLNGSRRLRTRRVLAVKKW